MPPGNQQVPAQARPSKAQAGKRGNPAAGRFGLPDELEKNFSEELVIPAMRNRQA
jgi:hypothetical protein